MTAVEFAGEPDRGAFEVAKDVRPLDHDRGSVASIGSLSLLGEPIIDIKARAGRHAAGRLGVRQANQSAARSMRLTTTASDGLAGDSASSSPTCGGPGHARQARHRRRAVQRAERRSSRRRGDVTEAINQGKGTLGGLMNDPAAYNSLKASLENLGDDRADQQRPGRARPAPERRGDGPVDLGAR